MKTSLLTLLAIAATLAAPAEGQPGRSLSPDPLGYVSPSRDFDAVHTKVDLELDVKGKRIAGSVTHTLRALKPNVRDVRLNCIDLDVQEVRVDGHPVEFDYPVTGSFSTSWIEVADTRGATDELVVHLPEAAEIGKPFELSVSYSGAPSEGLYFVAPEKGIPEKRLEVWAQGEGEDNRYWIPCFDYPNDKATYEGIYRVDKGMTVISNGVLVEQKDIGDQTQFHWKLATPQVSYLITVAASNYKVVEERWRDVPLMYVVPPGTDDETVLRGYGLTADMMEFFANYTGIDYPFEKYAQITVQNFIYGGMENTGATVMNMRMLYDEHWAATATEQGLVAHELAHQWWGDMVTCAEWSHIWLNEGFATYFQGLFREHHDGDDEFRYQMEARHRRTVELEDKDARPMVVDFYNRKDKRNSANVYLKGASVLHMLRFVIGDELFRASMTNYGERFKYDVAETSDFVKVVKQTTGENLDWFFEQWVYLAGHPKLHVTKNWDPESNMLRLGVSQTQEVKELTPLFRLPMDVEITCEEKTETYRIVVETAQQDFHFNLPSKPLMVLVDKGDWTLKTVDFPKSGAELLYQLGNGDTMARIRAARALAESKTRTRAVEALRTVVLTEGEFWGLRHEAALALGKIGTEPAEAALLEALGSPEARVRKACAVAMGDLENSRKRDKVLRDLVDNDFAYEVRAEALKSLVKMRSEAAEKACVAALAIPSARDVIRRAALDGLADLEASGALGKIEPLTSPGNRRTYRHAAIKAYARLAATLEDKRDRERAGDHLAGMLDDWYLRTRREVITALGTLGEKTAVNPLRRAAASDPVEALRAQALRTADRIETAEASIAKSESLEAEVKALSARIESLQRDLSELKATVRGSGDSDRLSKNDEDEN